LAFNLRRFLHNLKVWEPPERPWHSIIITRDLRGVPKQLDADKDVAINEDANEEYLTDADNRVLFDDPKHNWGKVQLYFEWDVTPASIWGPTDAIKEVPVELRTWYFSKSQNKMVNAVPSDPKGVATFVLTNEEYYFQQVRVKARHKAQVESLRENKSLVAKYLVGTVIVTMCLVLVIGMFINTIKANKAVNPVAAISGAYNSVTGKGKQ
jgi:hypothetical protein